MTSDKNCRSCKNTNCEFYKQRDVLCGTIDSEGDKMLSPSTFTSMKGCGEWK